MKRVDVGDIISDISGVAVRTTEGPPFRVSLALQQTLAKSVANGSQAVANWSLALKLHEAATTSSTFLDMEDAEYDRARAAVEENPAAFPSLVLAQVMATLTAATPPKSNGE